jgi:hypothetical protein
VLADAVEDEMRRAGFERAHFAGNSLLRYMRGLGHTPMSDAPDELAECRARRQAIRPR